MKANHAGKIKCVYKFSTITSGVFLLIPQSTHYTKYVYFFVYMTLKFNIIALLVCMHKSSPIHNNTVNISIAYYTTHCRAGKGVRVEFVNVSNFIYCLTREKLFSIWVR